MRMVQGTRELAQNVLDEWKWQSAACYLPVERFSLHQRHGDECHSIGFANIKNRDDVGMLQLGGDSRLGDEAFSKVRVCVQVIRKNLECDPAPETGLSGAINLTHGTLAYQLSEFVSRQIFLVHIQLYS